MKRLFWSAAAAALITPGVALTDGYHHDDDDDFNGFEGGLRFEATLSAAQEVATPPVVSDASGRAIVWFDKALSQVFVDVRVRGVSVERFRAAHFHCQRPGINGPVAFGLQNPGPLVFDGRRVRGVLTNANVGTADCVPLIGRPINNLASLAFAMRDGLVYVNVHTIEFPGGEIRGQLIEHEDSGRW